MGSGDTSLKDAEYGTWPPSQARDAQCVRSAARVGTRRPRSDPAPRQEVGGRFRIDASYHGRPPVRIRRGLPVQSRARTGPVVHTVSGRRGRKRVNSNSPNSPKRAGRTGCLTTLFRLICVPIEELTWVQLFKTKTKYVAIRRLYDQTLL
jgi:hypothetical protein